MVRSTQFSPRATARRIVTVAPKAAPDSSAAQQLVANIRAQVIPHALGGQTQLRAAVGGLPAELRDLDHAVSSSFPLVLVAVLGASFLLLLVAFRSFFVSLKAIAMNLLSLGAAYGLLVLVFQQGHLKHVFGVSTTGFIEVTMPLFTFAILFGLSMDYEVFLVSRIKEEWEHSHDTRHSVGRGLAKTARVISAAALIMVAVFASFMGTAVLEVKQIGFGLAIAVLVDATLVRLLLVPAFMRLAGGWNWWLPTLARAPSTRPRRVLTEAKQATLVLLARFARPGLRGVCACRRRYAAAVGRRCSCARHRVRGARPHARPVAEPATCPSAVDRTGTLGLASPCGMHCGRRRHRDRCRDNHRRSPQRPHHVVPDHHSPAGGVHVRTPRTRRDNPAAAWGSPSGSSRTPRSASWLQR